MKTLKVGNKEYALRITTRVIVSMEDRLGRNPLTVFGESRNGNLPKLGDLMIMLHGALQSLNHGISLDQTYDIYDEWVSEGNTIADLILLLIDVLREGGFISEDDEAESVEKN